MTQPPKMQCTAMTQTKGRCSRIAQHFTGTKSICEEHHRVWVANKQKEKK